MCNVKVIACSDEPTEDYELTLQIPSAPQSILVCFSSLFWVYGPHLFSLSLFPNELLYSYKPTDWQIKLVSSC